MFRRQIRSVLARFFTMWFGLQFVIYSVHQQRQKCAPTPFPRPAHFSSVQEAGFPVHTAYCRTCSTFGYGFTALHGAHITNDCTICPGFITQILEKLLRLYTITSKWKHLVSAVNMEYIVASSIYDKTLGGQAWLHSTYNLNNVNSPYTKHGIGAPNAAPELWNSTPKQPNAFRNLKS